MPQLGANIRRIGLSAAETDNDEPPIRLFDGETANFELSLTNVSPRPAKNVSVVCTATPSEYTSICTLSNQNPFLEPGLTMAVQVTQLPIQWFLDYQTSGFETLA